MIPKLRGKRTYILAALAILTELVKWAVGDQSLGALMDHLPAIFGELSVAPPAWRNWSGKPPWPAATIRPPIRRPSALIPAP
jgi:hypothetical protein